MLARLISWCGNTKSEKVLILLSFFCFSVFGTGSARSDGPKLPKAPVKSAKDTLLSTEHGGDLLSKLDSLMVIHFHPTVQCSCCINVGNFAKKGLEKHYAKPFKDGRIIFKEYNIDEDSSTAKRYKIFWSALGFEKFSRGKNEFKEIESVWEFCEEEKKFLLNFRNELNQFISTSKKDKPRPKTRSKKSE